MNFNNSNCNNIVEYNEFLDENDCRPWHEYIVIKYNDKLMSKYQILAPYE
jgi:hypothetical protein